MFSNVFLVISIPFKNILKPNIVNPLKSGQWIFQIDQRISANSLKPLTRIFPVQSNKYSGIDTTQMPLPYVNSKGFISYALNLIQSIEFLDTPDDSSTISEK